MYYQYDIGVAACVHVLAVVLMAVSGLAVLLLSPLIVEIVNWFRPRDKQLISSEEIADAYDFHLTRIFICEACQAFWATVVTVGLSDSTSKISLFFICYMPVLVTWLYVKALYKKVH